MAEELGPNGHQVVWLLHRLEALSPSEWKALADGDAASLTTDSMQAALALVIQRAGARSWWDRARWAAEALAATAAQDYATATGEQARYIEYSVTRGTWEGEREVTGRSSVRPSHTAAFREAACNAVGVLVMRPFGSAAGFVQFWRPYEDVIGLADAERRGLVPGSPVLIRMRRPASSGRDSTTF